MLNLQRNACLFFSPILKNEVSDGYTKNNKQKNKYVSTKTHSGMTDKEYLSLRGKGNLTQEVKASTCSLIMDEDNPPVLLGHFLVGV